jgi:hypothetical protein
MTAAAQEGGATTLTQCAADLEYCVVTTPFVTSFICPAEFQLCTARLAVRAAEVVVSAIDAAVECQRVEIGCLASATTAPKVALCAEDRAQCVASIVGIELPHVIEGTTQCIDSATDCILASNEPGDVAACGSSLRSCAVEQVKTVVPPTVVEVIDGVEACRKNLGYCINDAGSPSKIAECNEFRLACVANVFGVALPELHGSDLLQCGEQAQACGFEVSGPGDVAQCARQLGGCVGSVAGEVIEEQLTCEQKWTACMRENPTLGGFYICAGEVIGCVD